MRKLFLTAALALSAALPALADKPPDSLFKHVTTTSQLVHRGECDVQSLKLANTPCLIFYDQKLDRVWLVLFDEDKNGQPQVTRVMLVTADGKEQTSWCRQNVCL